MWHIFGISKHSRILAKNLTNFFFVRGAYAEHEKNVDIKHKSPHEGNQNRPKTYYVKLSFTKEVQWQGYYEISSASYSSFLEAN